jgi:hypothetical protein
MQMPITWVNIETFHVLTRWHIMIVKVEYSEVKVKSKVGQGFLA